MAERTKYRKYQGGVTFGQSFEIRSGSPMDDRLVVDSVADLTDSEVWLAGDNGYYTYKGMVVSVASTGDLYVFKGDSGNATTDDTSADFSGSVCNINNWVHIASGTGSAITLTSSTENNNYFKQYTLSQGGNSIGTIDIPKDLVVQSGSIVTGLAGQQDNAGLIVDNANIVIPDGIEGNKYIKLVIANQTAPLYISVNDLVDVYTTLDYTGDHANDIVQLDIDNSNTITASIKNGSITSTQLDQSTNDILDGAVTGYSNTNGSFVSLSKNGRNLTASVDVATIQSSSFYTAAEAITYNSQLENALPAETPLTESQVSEYNSTVSGASKQTNDTLTDEEAAAYNATLTGAVKEGDFKAGSDGLVSASGLVDYVSDAIAGADNALYSISSGNSKYISVTSKNADPDNDDDDHTQQISANVVTLASYNGVAANDGLISTSEVYNALTWN